MPRHTRRIRLNLEQLEERETPSASALLGESFDQLAAPALPADWSQWSNTSNALYSTSAARSTSGANSLISNGPSNASGRFWKYDAVSAAGTVQANVLLDSLIPVQLLARGRDLNSATPDYYAVSITRGLQVDLIRVVDGVSYTLGTLKSTVYFSQKWVNVRLTLDGDQLKVQIYRVDTRQFLNSQGNWVAAESFALQATDSAIAGGGQVGINRPARYAGIVAIDDFAFAAKAGTTVSESFNTAALAGLPAGWSRWSSDGQLGFGASAVRAVDGLGLLSSGTSTRASRTWFDASNQADGQASASIFADSLIPAQVFARGTHLDGKTPSYYAATVTRGTTVSLVRVVDGVSTTLAQLTSKTYANNVWLRVSLTVQANQLQARVQRADTGQWLNADGIWQASPVAALDAQDGVITGAGQAGLARAALYAGNAAFDDFKWSTNGLDITAPGLQVIIPNGGVDLAGRLNISVAVQDPSGIAKVEYLVDDLLTAVVNTGPFNWTLDTRNFNNGFHHILVRVYDLAGNRAEYRQRVNFLNQAPYTLPDIASHYKHIRLALLAYSGNPMGAFEQQLLQSSIDLVVPNPRYLETINQTSPDTPQLIYSNVSNLYLELLTDWLKYADDHGISREAAFYHVTAPTRFNGASASAQPVNWFWNAELGPVAGTSGFKKLTSEARDAKASDVAFGAARQALYLGYTDKFREINVTLSRASQAGWSSVVEYATAVDAQGNPTGWKTLTLLTDSTNGLAYSGQLTFDPPADWVSAIVPGSLAELFYVRIRTTAGTAAQAPIAAYILGRDYVNARGSTSGVIPAFDAAADANGDGYLNNAEFATRTGGKDARFAYESRLFYPYYGQMRFITNPTSDAIKEWAADYHLRTLATYPKADGFFLDNSSGKNPIPNELLLESTATYTADYGAMLATINRSIAPRWIIANTSNGGPETDQVVRQVPATMEEFAIRAMAHTWQQFLDLSAIVARRQAAIDPTPYLVLDSLSTGGAPTSFRTQMATLAYYYLLGDPKKTFLMLWGGEEPASTWSRHYFNALATDVGAPTTAATVFATGKDPANTALTYNIYGREYENALVLYKPLSYALGKGTGTNSDTSATTHVLGGTFRVLNSDGTLSGPVTSITLRNSEGVVLIKS